MARVDLQSGEVIGGDFRVERPLGAGGIGTVYVVEQMSTRKRRALRILQAEALLEGHRERFEREAVVTARIQSDHIVEVIRAGVEPDGTPWIVLELLDGETLDAWGERAGTLPPHDVLECMRQLCHGVGAAHDVGIVHRDLKPENIFVVRSRRAGGAFTVKVLDFGIAKLIDTTRRAATASTTIGSPLWMAPEQMNPDAAISAATDIWALGLIVFRLLTGRSYWCSANTEGFNLYALMIAPTLLSIPPVVASGPPPAPTTTGPLHLPVPPPQAATPTRETTRDGAWGSGARRRCREGPTRSPSLRAPTTEGQFVGRGANAQRTKMWAARTSRGRFHRRDPRPRRRDPRPHAVSGTAPGGLIATRRL